MGNETNRLVTVPERGDACENLSQSLRRLRRPHGRTACLDGLLVDLGHAKEWLECAIGRREGDVEGEWPRARRVHDVAQLDHHDRAGHHNKKVTKL